MRTVIMQERLIVIHARTYQTGDGSENHTCRGHTLCTCMALCGAMFDKLQHHTWTAFKLTEQW